MQIGRVLESCHHPLDAMTAEQFAALVEPHLPKRAESVNGEKMPSVPLMREAFESYIKSSERFKDSTPLGIVEINGKFHHYMNPDTDTMWIGFGLGFRSHHQALSRAESQTESMEAQIRAMLKENDCDNDGRGCPVLEGLLEILAKYDASRA